MIFKYFSFFLLLSPLIINGQNYISGKVVDENNNPLVNTSIYWINTNIGSITDSEGNFKIKNRETNNNKIIISFVGYQNDTITIKNSYDLGNIPLQPETDLKTINLTENKVGTYVDKINAIKTEIITAEELTKAACCDLAGCFETQISVESKTTNIITNTKELSILGLSGIYNQILIDGIPIVNGANYTYGISAIPGTIIDNIHISQGLTSVLQGHESISGQINIQLKGHQETEKVFLNLYTNSFNAKQLNIDYNYKINNWKNILSIHSSQPAKINDINNDNFLDLPKTTKYSIYNKWIYGLENNDGIFTAITLRYLDEERIGGEIDFEPKDNLGDTINYGQKINFQQPEIHISSSFNFNNKAIIFKSALSQHKQNSFFGTTKYLVDQKQYYFKLAYSTNWNDHNLESGFSFKNLIIDERIELNNNFNQTYGGEYFKNEKIPGLFIENKFKWQENIELITGFRLDNHNTHGWMHTPRMLLKYNFSENTVGRLNCGSGWKTVNLFTEYVKLFGSNENIIIGSNLKPEKATNFGFNLLHAIYLNNIELQFILDAYSTSFRNQIFPDYDTNPQLIILENFQGKSKSNSLQAEIGIEIINEIGIKLAYNYLDVYRIQHNHKHRLPFISKHHILNTFSYKPINKNWHFDFNLHWFGRKKLQNTSNNPIEYQRPKYSKPYSMLNLQFTQKIKYIEFYIGCENILNFNQENPIISANDPFGQYFNISNIWGPTKGREAYLGLRLKL